MEQVIYTGTSATLVDAEYFRGVLNAWIRGRPNAKIDTPEESAKAKSELSKMDAQILDFETMTFEIECPIIVRDVLAIMVRDHIMWVVSSRAEKTKGVRIWSGLNAEEKNRCESLITSVHEKLQGGVAQDIARLQLPLATMSKFTLRISYRKLARLLKTLIHTKSKAMNSLSSALINSLPFSMCLLLSETMNVVTELPMPFVTNENIFPTVPIVSKHVKNGNCITYTGIVPHALLSQFVRHRDLNFLIYGSYKDIDEMLSSPYCLSQYINAFGSVEAWRAIVAARNCWIAQTDLWFNITEPAKKLIPGESVHKISLPCFGLETCPYMPDQRLRMEGKDVAPPCPIAAGMEGAKPTEQQLSLMRSYSEKRPEQKFWNDEIQKHVPDYVEETQER